jgi:hypothetical protein
VGDWAKSYSSLEEWSFLVSFFFSDAILWIGLVGVLRIGDFWISLGGVIGV